MSAPKNSPFSIKVKLSVEITEDIREKIDVCFIAQFVDRHEIRLTQDAIRNTSTTRKIAFYCDAALIFFQRFSVGNFNAIFVTPVRNYVAPGFFIFY